MTKIRRWITNPLGEWGEVEIARKRKHIVRNVAVGSVAVAALLWSLWSLADRTRQNDVRTAELVAYQTQLDVYRTQLEQHTTCLNGVETREIYRERFLASAESKRRFAEIIDLGVDGDAQRLVDELYVVVEEEIADLEADLPPRDPAECPAAPTIPLPPGTPATTLPEES